MARPSWSRPGFAGKSAPLSRNPGWLLPSPGPARLMRIQQKACASHLATASFFKPDSQISLTYPGAHLEVTIPFPSLQHYFSFSYFLLFHCLITFSLSYFAELSLRLYAVILTMIFRMCNS